MEKRPRAGRLTLRKMDVPKQAFPYYSVEFSIEGLNAMYQFKLWNIRPRGMYFLVREDSNVLTRLKEGDRMAMKYYPSDSADPPRYLDTSVRHIIRNEQGRFKGHYSVRLEIQ
jgi:hypothetical protein